MQGGFYDEAGGELTNVSIEIIEGADKGKAVDTHIRAIRLRFRSFAAAGAPHFPCVESRIPGRDTASLRHRSR